MFPLGALSQESGTSFFLYRPRGERHLELSYWSKEQKDIPDSCESASKGNMYDPDFHWPNEAISKYSGDYGWPRRP